MSASSLPGERVEFESSTATLWGEVWRPAGAGPFPTVLWNHGSQGRNLGLQAPRTTGPTVLETWLSLGLAVFAPSRRGYDGSGGQPWTEAVAGAEDRSPEKGRLLVSRLLAESDDVLAAAEYLERQPWVDARRLVCSGYSFGGVMTMLGLARSRHFAAGINFASAAIMWPQYPAVRELLLSRAAAIVDPVMVLQAENDYSTAPTPAIAAVFERTGLEHRAVIYPPHGAGPEDGHAFCALGARTWGPEVHDFLAEVGALGG
jgi:dienelactone hydrolase